MYKFFFVVHIVNIKITKVSKNIIELFKKNWFFTLKLCKKRKYDYIIYFIAKIHLHFTYKYFIKLGVNINAISFVYIIWTIQISFLKN